MWRGSANGSTHPKPEVTINDSRQTIRMPQYLTLLRPTGFHNSRDHYLVSAVVNAFLAGGIDGLLEIVA